MQTLPTAMAAAAAGIPYAELSRWIDRRVITPSVLGQPGIPHQFARNAVVVLTIASALHCVGVPPRVAVRHAELFFNSGPDDRRAGEVHPFQKTWLIVDGEDARIVLVPYGAQPGDVTALGPATLQANCDALVEIAEAAFGPERRTFPLHSVNGQPIAEWRAGVEAELNRMEVSR